MNIAIVDDSPDDRTHLSEDIKKYADDNTLIINISEYESGEIFLNKVHTSSLDMVFLDIYMTGINGMNVAYEIRKLNPSCQIVFVTSSADFAVQSYDVRAFYYIVKPCSYENVANVMEKHGQNRQMSARYIMVKEGRDWCKVMLDDILYVDYSNHYVQIHTESSIVSTYIKFPEMEEKLLAFSEFLSCYRCIVINMNKIKKVDDLFFLISNGEYVPINRKHAKEIKAHYMDYVFNLVGNVNDNCSP